MTATARKPRSEGLPVMTRVIVAIVLREVTTRFGRRRLGLVWALAEPCIYILGFVVIRTQIRSSSIPFGDSFVLFFISGLLSFRIFMTIASSGLGSLSSNLALLTYSPVRPLDVIFGRILLEVLTMYMVFAIFFAGLFLTSEQKIIFHVHQIVGGLGALTVLAVGFSVFNAVFSAINRIWARVWRLMMLPLLLFSGVFYLPGSMPLGVQKVIVFNPVLHGIEWLRSGFYLTYNPMLDRAYILFFGAVMLALGLTLERIYRTKIQSL